jgi:poly-gamma-glutamate capsule biosynthesis protein CapA/YwtB (metallophosphatase superfamily)
VIRTIVLVALAAFLVAGAAEGGKKKKPTKKKGKAVAAKKAPPEPPPRAPEADVMGATVAPPEGSIRIAAVGDVMMGTTFPDDSGRSLAPDDGAGMLAEVAPLLQGVDLAFGNLEGPLLEGGVSAKCGTTPTGRCYAFRVPPRYATYLAEAGFDVMSVANNHAMDFGDPGRQSSKTELEARGVAATGEPGSYTVVNAAGKRVAVVAFATYAHSNNLNDLAAATELVTKAGSEADLVIVSFHGGAEGSGRCRVPYGAELFYNENRGDLRVFTKAMIDAGADLVLGHGPHVVRGMEIYKDRLIAYSLGNFATYGAFNLKGLPGLTVLLEVTLAPDGAFVGGKAHAVKQPSPGGPKLDPTGEVLPILRGLSKADFGDAAVKVAADGTLGR